MIKKLSLLLLTVSSFYNIAQLEASSIRKLYPKPAVHSPQNAVNKTTVQRPLYALDYQYTNKYDYKQTSRLHYNKSGLVDSVVVTDTSKSANLFYSTLQYDSRQRTILQLIFPAKGTGYDHPIRLKTEYDSSNDESFSITEKTTDGINFAIESGAKFTKKYDAQGRYTRRFTFSWNPTTNQFDSSSVTVLTWPSIKGKGYTDSLTYDVSSSGPKYNDFRYTKIVWDNFAKRHIKRTVLQQYDPVAMKWSDTLSLNYIWTNEDFVRTDSDLVMGMPTEKIIYKAQPYGSNTFTVFEYNMGSSKFDSLYRAVNNYDAEGNQVLGTEEQYNASASRFRIVNGFRVLFTNDANGNHLVRTTESWDNSTKSFAPESKRVYRNYGAYTGLDADVLVNSADKTFRLYPNPAANELYISVNQSDVLVSIRSITGALLYQFRSVNGISERLDISAFARGMYLVEISGAHQVPQVLKLVKE